jgi:arylsulfatase A-like enzyme
LIVTDDQDVGTLSFMPSLDEVLVERGASFRNAFVVITACSPSRASILRGQYSHNHGLLLNDGPDGGFHGFHALALEDSTLATWLQSAGYRTALVGKYLNGYEEPSFVPPGWDEWYVKTKKGYYDYVLSENGRAVAYGSEAPDYLTDVLSRKAVEFIGRDAEKNQPFFLYLAPWAPHRPAVPAPRHSEEFASLRAPRPPSFDEEDVSDKPEYIRARRRLSSEEIAETDALYRNRIRSLQAVDEMVAAIVEILEETDQIENTYIVFTSDSGYHLGQHRLRRGKGGPYEENIRVPLVIRGPGIPAGRSIDRFALNIDLAPTLAEFARLSVPAFVDGRSLAPVLAAKGLPAEPWRQSFLIEHWGDVKAFRTLRTENATYVEYENGERELYDLSRDPHELTNAYSTADPQLLDRLSSRLGALGDCAGQSCRDIEDAPMDPVGGDGV